MHDAEVAESNFNVVFKLALFMIAAHAPCTSSLNLPYAPPFIHVSHIDASSACNCCDLHCPALRAGLDPLPSLGFPAPLT